GGHKHTSELRRWDQAWNKPWRATEEAALAELALIGVRAAVLAHQDEVGKWFSWPIEWPIIADLITARRLIRPGAGWLAAATHRLRQKRGGPAGVQFQRPCSVEDAQS